MSGRTFTLLMMILLTACGTIAYGSHSNRQTAFTLGSDTASEGQKRVDDEQQDDTKVVVVTGIGRDHDAAVRNALRNAVENVVGALVDSEVLVNNDTIVDDTVLSHSAGFVETYDEVDQSKQIGDGLVSVRIKAVVKNRSIIHALKKASISVTEIDGKGLFAEMVTKDTEQQSTVKLVEKQLIDFPENVLSFTPNKPRYNAQTGKILVDVEIKINKAEYKKLIRNLSTALTQSFGNPKKEFHVVEDSQYWGYRFGKYGEITSSYSERKSCLFLCESVNAKQTGSDWLIYNVGEELVAKFSDAILYKELYVGLISEDDDVISSKQIKALYPAHIYTFAHTRSFIIVPVLCNLDKWSNDGYVRPGTASAVIPFEFDISPEEAKHITSIRCEMRKAKKR